MGGFEKNISVRVEDNATGFLKKRNINRFTPMVFHSSNAIGTGNGYLLLSSVGGQSYLIIRVMLKVNKSKSLSVSPSGASVEGEIKIFPYALQKKSLPFTDFQPVVLDLPHCVNKLSHECPEVIPLLYALARYALVTVEKKRTLDMSIMTDILIKLLGDPLFRCWHSKPIGIAAAKLCQIFGSIANVQKIQALISDISKELRLPPNAKDETKGDDYSKLVKHILSNNLNEKRKILFFLETQLATIKEKQAIDEKNFIKIDRILQRNQLLSEFIIPLFPETDHRLNTNLLMDFLEMKDLEVKKYIKYEDIGILRDLAEFIVFLYITSKESEAALAKMISYESVKLKIKDIWNDEDSDKLSSSKDSSKGAVMIREEIRIALKSEIYLGKLTEVLAELANREGINAKSFEIQQQQQQLSASVQPLLTKWKNLIEKLPKFWKEVSSRIDSLASTAPSEDDREFEGGAIGDRLGLKKVSAKVADDKRQSVTDPRLIEDLISTTDSEIIPKDYHEIHQRSLQLSSIESQSQSDWTDSKSLHSTLKLFQTEENIKDHGEPNSNPLKTSKRRGNKQNSERKVHQLVGEVVELKCEMPTPIKYHSLENLFSAYKTPSATQTNFFLSSSGSEILAVANEKLSSAKLCIYDEETNTLVKFFLEDNEQSSLCIWNSVAFLHFDDRMARRSYPRSVSLNFKSCLLYADLRETFSVERSTKGLVVFTPILKIKEELINRAIIADERGIYVFGGYSLFSTASKNPFCQSSVFKFYDISQLDSIGTDEVDGYPGNMNLKRDDLVVSQTERNVFILNRMMRHQEQGNLELEVFEKLDKGLCWVLQAKIPIDSYATSYSMSVIKGKEREDLLLIVGSCEGNYSFGLMIDPEKLSNEQPAEIMEKLGKNDEGVLKGFVRFPLQHTYCESSQLSICNCANEILELQPFNSL